MSQKSHDYERFAAAYAGLGISDTYYLAYRDLPAIIEQYASGKTALDHGCGSGRSAVFLKELGYSVTGVDTSPQMIQEAKQRDPKGIYQLIDKIELSYADSTFDLILQAIVSMEFPNRLIFDRVFSEMSRVLKETGTAIVITHNAEHCVGEWSSFTWITPKDKQLKSGEQAEVIIRGTGIKLRDYMWFHSDFEQAFARAGLRIEARHQPLATGEEPYHWYQETTMPYWDIYVLKKY